MLVICHFNMYLTEAGVMRKGGYVCFPFGYLHLSIFRYLESPLSSCTLNFDLMKNLYIYNAYISFFSCNEIHKLANASTYLQPESNPHEVQRSSEVLVNS